MALWNPLGDLIDDLTQLIEGLDSDVSEISEADELRKDEVAGIMEDVFTKDVVENWDSLSDEAKTELLNEYYTRAGDALGIHTTEVYVEDLQAMYGEGTMGYNSGDGAVHVDISCLKSVDQLPELLNTVTHEMRHQLQTEAILHPERFPDIPDTVLMRWGFEKITYISPEYDFEGYYNQAIEVDARNFGESVVDSYIESMA